MSDTLREFLSEYDNTQFATRRGTEMHNKIRAVHMENGDLCGDDEIIENIKKHPEIMQFFLRKFTCRSAGRSGNKKQFYQPPN